MDGVVKALTKNRAQTDRCFVHSDYVTYFDLMGHDATPEDAAPYLPHAAGGAPAPWLRVGDAVVAYLDPPPQLGPDQRRGMRFLRFERGEFRDVTAEVVDGRLPIAPH